MLRKLLVVSVVAGLVACGESGGEKPDSGTPDAGQKPDSGVVSDAGVEPDAGTETDGGTEPVVAQFPDVFVDDFAADLSIADFGGATNAVTVDATEKHAGEASLKVAIPASGYTGGAFVIATPQDLSPYNALTFWAKASTDGKTLNVAGMGNNAAVTTYQVEWTGLALTTTWTRYVIPLPDPSKLTAEAGLFHFAEGSDEGEYTIWFDDMRYETLASGVLGTPVPAIATESQNKLVGDSFTVNGTSLTIPVNGTDQTLAVARAWFDYTSSDEAVATVEAGGLVKAVGVGSAEITARLGSVAANGKVTVNVSLPQAPTAAAPAPTAPAADVISLLSGGYTNRTVDTWSTGWDSADVSDETIGGAPTKKYTNLAFAGIEFFAASGAVDASAMTAFHIDLWSPNATVFKVKLVDFGANGVWSGGDDTEHELTFDATTTPALTQGNWVSLDIPLASFTGMTARAHLAQLILSSDNATVYVQNVYFHK